MSKKKEKTASKQRAENKEDINQTLTNEDVNSTDNGEKASEENGVDFEAELAESKDKYLRLYSEFENFRRRTAKERIELIGTASREVIQDLLPVMDDFERALKVIKENNTEDEGVTLIYNKLSSILTSKGLKKMEIKSGDSFDDNFHEAITQIPAPEKKLAGKIVDVVEPGYYLSDKVIRFAKVVTGAKE